MIGLANELLNKLCKFDTAYSTNVSLIAWNRHRLLLFWHRSLFENPFSKFNVLKWKLREKSGTVRKSRPFVNIRQQSGRKANWVSCYFRCRYACKSSQIDKNCFGFEKLNRETQSKFLIKLNKTKEEKADVNHSINVHFNTFRTTNDQLLISINGARPIRKWNL